MYNTVTVWSKQQLCVQELNGSPGQAIDASQFLPSVLRNQRTGRASLAVLLCRAALGVIIHDLCGCGFKILRIH